MAHDDFLSFMQSVVIPRKAANPNDIRLDGELTGGNREVVGSFWHIGQTWVVHADTHYEPLFLAHEAAAGGVDPFAVEDTPRGRCLTLVTELRARQSSPHKYLYIYSWAGDSD